MRAPRRAPALEPAGRDGSSGAFRGGLGQPVPYRPISFATHVLTGAPMNLRHVASCGLACAVLLLAGCDEGRQPPGKVGVRLRERGAGLRGCWRSSGNENQVAGLRRCRSRRPQTPRLRRGRLRLLRLGERALGNERCATHLDVRAESRGRITSYTFVLTEVGGEVQPVVIEHPEPLRRMRSSSQYMRRAACRRSTSISNGPASASPAPRRAVVSPRKSKWPRGRSRAATTSSG